MTPKNKLGNVPSAQVMTVVNMKDAQLADCLERIRGNTMSFNKVERHMLLHEAAKRLRHYGDRIDGFLKAMEAMQAEESGLTKEDFAEVRHEIGEHLDKQEYERPGVPPNDVQEQIDRHVEQMWNEE